MAVGLAYKSSSNFSQTRSVSGRFVMLSAAKASERARARLVFPRTCPSLRIERSLILQYPAPVCNLEYLPGFVLERKSTLHQMSAEKEHWVMADQSEWVVLKELNNGFQQC